MGAAAETRSKKGPSCERIFFPNLSQGLKSLHLSYTHSLVRCQLQKCFLAQNHRAPVPILPLLTQEEVKAQGQGPRPYTLRGRRKFWGFILPSPINRSEKLGPEGLGQAMGTFHRGEERAFREKQGYSGDRRGWGSHRWQWG